MLEVQMILENEQLTTEERGKALDRLETQVKQEIREAERKNVDEYRYCQECKEAHLKSDYTLHKKNVLNTYFLWYGKPDEPTGRTEYTDIYVLRCPKGHYISQDRNAAGYYIDRIGGEDLNEVLAYFSNHS